jgi:hypothetical protein
VSISRTQTSTTPAGATTSVGRYPSDQALVSVDRHRTGTREQRANPAGKNVLKKEETKESELELSTKGAD